MTASPRPDAFLLAAALGLLAAMPASGQTSAGGTLDLVRVVSVDPAGTAGAVDGVALSPDGTRIVSGDNKATARVYRASDGALLRTVVHQPGLSGVAGELNAVDVSPDGTLFCTGINDFGTKVWRLSDGALLRHLTPNQTADGCAFSADGRWFASGAGTDVRVYSLPDFDPVAAVGHPLGEANSIDFSSDGALMVSGAGSGTSGTVRITRTSDWQVVRTISVGGSVKSVRFSPDGALVAIGARSKISKVFRVADGAEVADLPHEGNTTPLPGDDLDSNPAVEAVAWSADGTHLLTSGLIDGVMRLWRRADWSLVDYVQAQEADRAIEYIDVAGDAVVVGGDEGSVYAYRLTTPAVRAPYAPAGPDALVVAEAESADTNLPQGGAAWEPVADGAAVSGQALAALPNVGVVIDAGYQTYDPKEDSPKLDFRVRFDQAGTYYVWVRGNAGGSTADNSCHVGLDGREVSAATVQFDDLEGWTWSSTRKAGGRATLAVDGLGERTVNVWMREDGFQIDKLVLTRSSSYSPASVAGGLGPAESAREDTVPPPPTGAAPVGQTVWLQATVNGRFVAADLTRAGALIADRTEVRSWERFLVTDGADQDPATVALRAEANGRFVAARPGAVVTAADDQASPAGRFAWEPQPDGSVCLRSQNTGAYVVAEDAGASPLRADRSACQGWERFAWGVASGAGLVAAAPETLSLAAYPNPASGRATVAFALPDAAGVELAVYDVLGRRVALLAEGAFEAGHHEADFDGSALPAGLYFVQLRAGDAVRTQHLTLAR